VTVKHTKRKNVVPSGDPPTVQGIHVMIVESLVGELWTPKLAQIFAYGKWLYRNHTECYYMARQIWTKDV